MGYPMAGRLHAAGYHLAIFDVNSDTSERFAGEFTCRVCSSAVQAAQDADIVIIIDTSSSAPLRSRELAEILTEHHIIEVFREPFCSRGHG